VQAIDEKTKVSLFAAVVCIPFIVGAVLWMSSVDSKASAAQEQTREIKPMLQDILMRLIRIEAQRGQ
jgi:hypothetical protein